MKSLVSKLTAIALGLTVCTTVATANSALKKVMKERGVK